MSGSQAAPLEFGIWRSILMRCGEKAIAPMKKREGRWLAWAGLSPYRSLIQQPVKDSCYTQANLMGKRWNRDDAFWLVKNIGLSFG